MAIQLAYFPETTMSDEVCINAEDISTIRRSREYPDTVTEIHLKATGADKIKYIGMPFPHVMRFITHLELDLARVARCPKPGDKNSLGLG